MGRSALKRTLACAAALALAACEGDPVIFLGDLPGTMRVVAGIPDQAGSATGATGRTSSLASPRGVAAGASGVLYVGDRNGRVLAVGSDGRAREIVAAGTCLEGVCVGRIIDLALHGDETLLIADEQSHVVWSIDLASGGLTRLAGSGSQGIAQDGAVASASPLSGPSGLAVAADGRVYISERGAQAVRTIDHNGTLRTVAGQLLQVGFAGDGGPATQARLRAPAGLGISGDRLFIADSGNERVREVNLVTGTIRTAAGSGLAGFNGDGGNALAAQLSFPLDVAATEDGRTLYIADTRNNRIRAVDLLGGTISTFAGSGETAFSGDLGEAGRTALRMPSGVAVSPFGFLFIADTDHHVVWRTPVR